MLMCAYVWEVDWDACPEFLFLGISPHNHICAIHPQDYRGAATLEKGDSTP